MRTRVQLLAAIFFAGFIFSPGCQKENKQRVTAEEETAPSPDNGQTTGSTVTPIQIYGVWHAGNDYCIWGTERDTAGEFKTKNKWLIDRGNGNPSVNLVILSFVHPLKLLNKTNDATTKDGVPKGMTAAVVKFFKDRGIRVMLAIGGITYTDVWDQALAQNATQLGLNAAAVAQQLGVGIDIDYEQNRNPKLPELEQFINAYRSIHPYDASGSNHAARLAICLAAGDRWLIDLCRKATADWLSTTNPVIDYANAMVPARQPSASSAIANWQEHVDGKPQYGPPILPLAPAKFTGSLWLVDRKAIAECNNFNNSLQKNTASYVQTVLPKPGYGITPGMLGFMFWAAECQGTRAVCTTPPNSCEGGMGVAATTFNIPIPMPPLRQE